MLFSGQRSGRTSAAAEQAHVSMFTLCPSKFFFFCVSFYLFGCPVPRRPRDRGHPSSRTKLFRRRGGHLSSSPACLAEHSRLVFAPHLNKLGKPRLYPGRRRDCRSVQASSAQVRGFSLAACIVAKTNTRGFFVPRGERVRALIDTTWRRWRESLLAF